MALQQDDSNNLLWFLTGATIGAGVALLVAPQRGERTRRTLARQARRSGQAIADSSREIYEKGRDLYEKGREIAEDTADMFERGRRLAEKKIDENI